MAGGHGEGDVGHSGDGPRGDISRIRQRISLIERVVLPQVPQLARVLLSTQPLDHAVSPPDGIVRDGVTPVPGFALHPGQGCHHTLGRGEGRGLHVASFLFFTP